MSREELWGDCSFYPGDIVIDRDNPSGEGVVINLPKKQAHEWYVQGRGFLAKDNPEYPEDDEVVVIIFRSVWDAEFPYYSGVRPLILSELHERDLNYYAFPASRLQKVGKIEPFEIPVSKIFPSPYHSRTFDVDEELRLVAELDRQDGLPRPALLRVVDEDRFTILNGHKRLWAAHVLGYDSVKARCMYVDDLTAAQIFASRHIDDDPGESDHATPHGKRQSKPFETTGARKLLASRVCRHKNRADRLSLAQGAASARRSLSRGRRGSVPGECRRPRISPRAAVGAVDTSSTISGCRRAQRSEDDTARAAPFVDGVADARRPRARRRRRERPGDGSQPIARDGHREDEQRLRFASGVE